MPREEKHRATARDKRITVNTLSRHQNQNGRTDLRCRFTAPRAPVSASPAGQPIGDSTCTRSCAPTDQWETMHKIIFKATENHPARIWQPEVKREEKRQKKTER